MIGLNSVKSHTFCNNSFKCVYYCSKKSTAVKESLRNLNHSEESELNFWESWIPIRCLFISCGLTSASNMATFSSSSLITLSLSWITMREFWSYSTHRWKAWVSKRTLHDKIWYENLCLCAYTCTCSIICRSFLCWLLSMSSKWWIFSFRIAFSFSSSSNLLMIND